MEKMRIMEDPTVLQTKLQVKAFMDWVTARCRGSVFAATGFGKTRISVMACVYALKQSDLKVLYLTPTTVLKENFEDTMKELGHEHLLQRVELQCYASATKVKENKYACIIGDEIHLGLTEKCLKLYTAERAERMLFLTATPPENTMHRMMLQMRAPKVFAITLDQCVKHGFVAPYSLECVSVELNVEEKAKYKVVNNNFGHWKYILETDEDVRTGKRVYKALPNAFREASNIIATKGNSKEDYQAATGFYRAIRQRKKIIDNASAKVVMAATTIKALNKTALVFGGDNAFTNKLSEAIPGSLIYHSKITPKKRKEALAAFKAGTCKTLCSTKSLNQGVNVPESDLGLVCGLTSKALTMIQRLGRFIRRSKDPNKVGRVIVLYVKDSQEEKWLENAVHSINDANITWKSTKDLLKEFS